MIDYCVLNSEGFVVQSGQIQEENLSMVPVPEGGKLVPGVRAKMFGKKERIIRGQVVETDEPWHAPSYEIKRKEEYPQVGDQLEAIWEVLASLPGQKPEKALKILGKIAEVKAKHPKPDVAQGPKLLDP